ncbi:GNAT family N-acetyltransferase [Actinophytocola oryzae]|uniref:RimJ/RimL family protein N-acetyltransferase n=1 Tax=Actinophytocola oryzae TaxID=502181 RepID=A0A4V3FR06_9PSEU|nr:GNAT family N-acetyltransferase [Actinophytocola oryzae]TDV41701.1 RimJ/RimL family protein N-acetyltransferase [Actinophytocola oryzae]
MTGSPTTTGTLTTERLPLRPWQPEDAQAALEIYGDADVARWLAMPAGRWAVERTADRYVIGGAELLPLPPGDEDLEIAWQLNPAAWGHGYADEAMFAVASWAFDHDVDELFTVIRPENTETAATVRQNGMHWVGETTKYFGLELQVFRLRQADLDRTAPTAHRPPSYA